VRVRQDKDGAKQVRLGAEHLIGESRFLLRVHRLRGAERFHHRVG